MPKAMPTQNALHILTISRAEMPEITHEIPLSDSTIPAGFPSPTDESCESFDIVTHIVRRPESTFFMRVAGDSMVGAGIFDGDLLIVDRSLEAKSGDIVVAILDGEFTVKRFRCNHSAIELVPENPKYRKITLREGMEFEIWGVVMGTYKSFQ